MSRLGETILTGNPVLRDSQWTVIGYQLSVTRIQEFRDWEMLVCWDAGILELKNLGIGGFRDWEMLVCWDAGMHNTR